jgi:RHS repeat-associated protein
MFDPYGKVTVLDGNGTPRTVNESLYGNPWTFTGRRLDGETGLMYFRNRMYETGLGRFVSRDPWRTSEDEPSAADGYPDGWSLYGAYFLPLRTDPSGLMALNGNHQCECWDLEARPFGGGDNSMKFRNLGRGANAPTQTDNFTYQDPDTGALGMKLPKLRFDLRACFASDAACCPEDVLVQFNVYLDPSNPRPKRGSKWYEDPDAIPFAGGLQKAMPGLSVKTSIMPDPVTAQPFTNKRTTHVIPANIKNGECGRWITISFISLKKGQTIWVEMYKGTDLCKLLKIPVL